VKKAGLPTIKAAPPSNQFSINRFEISGNMLVPTDTILINLRDYYGSKKNRSDLKRIRRNVINLYHILGYYGVRIKVPSTIEDETVFIHINEKRIK